MRLALGLGLPFGGGGASGASALLASEPQGMALDFTGNNGAGQVAVKDTTTPANNKYNDPVDNFLTQSGTSPKLVLWSDGLYRWTGHNLILRSEAFDNASWTKSAGSVSADAVAAPDGSLTADKFVEDGTNAVHEINQAVTVTAGAAYTLKIDVQAAGRTWVDIDVKNPTILDYHTWFNLSGAGSVGTNDAANTSSITSLGGGWYRLTITHTAVAGQTSMMLAVRPATGDGVLSYQGDGASGLYLSGAQLNRGTVPTAYHVTTAAAWYGVPIEYDPTTAKFYALVEPQATNLALYASDFTNAAWVKSNMTTALTATGPDGVANSASTLTATAGNATALQAITSGSASRVTSMFVKRRTGSGVVNLTQDNGGTWIAVTATAGWTNVPLAAVTSANPTVGIRIVTSGDAVDVAWFQHELNAVTSPIPSFAASVTRATDILNAATSLIPYSATAGTLIVEVAEMSFQSVGGGSHFAGFSDGTSNEFVGTYEFGSQNSSLVRDGGVVQAAPANLVAVALGTYLKSAIAWAVNDVAAVANGGTVQTDATATLPTPNILRLGTGEGGSGTLLHGRYKSFTYVPRRMTNTEITTRTTL